MGKLAGVIEALAILLVVFLAKVDGRDESEEWGVTQLDHPLALFPSPRTCLKEGIQGTKCSESCLGSCKTPSCAMSCACACTTTKDREALARVLKGKGQEVKAMSTEFSLLDKQATLWREGLSAQYEHGVRKQQALHVASNGGLESQAHAQARKIAGSVKALPPKFDAATDSAGFSWDAMEPSSALHYRSPYAHEADEEINVYDPTLDPENVGNIDPTGTKNNWFSRRGKWWQHFGQYSAGTKY